MKDNDTFANSLGIESHQQDETTKELVTVPSKPPEELTKDTKEDYELSRNTFRALITKGNDAIEDLTHLARDSESPRSYEALATLMRTVAETTKDLYDLQKKTKDLRGLDAPGKKVLDSGDINIDKAVFVGTTTDLLKSLKKDDHGQ